MLHAFFFSPSETTRKYAKVMTDAYGGESQLINLTHGPCEVECELVDFSVHSCTKSVSECVEKIGGKP